MLITKEQKIGLVTALVTTTLVFFVVAPVIRRIIYHGAGKLEEKGVGVDV